MGDLHEMPRRQGEHRTSLKQLEQFQRPYTMGRSDSVGTLRVVAICPE